MRKTVKTLLATALLSTAVILPVASAQTLDSGVSSAQLYIANSSDITSPVNIYVDGQLFASNVFNDSSPSLFAKSITTGTHSVIVTRNYQAVGVDDLLNTTVKVPTGGSTLTLANNTTADPMTGLVAGYQLDLSNAQ